MEYRLGELAEHVSGELLGDRDLIIRGVGGIEDAKRGEITFVSSSAFKEKALSSKASAFIVRERLSSSSPQILVENPRLAFAQIAPLFLPPPTTSPGIHPKALVHERALLGEDVAIGPQVVIEEEAVIGARSILEANTYIGPRVTLGEDVHLHQNVVLRSGVELGDRVIIQANSVVGSDGFGYERTSQGWVKVPQLGRVKIEDDVEIGASVAIDKATTGVTHIGYGTKIDNQVQIGHNVKIGPHSLLVAMVGISGSSTLGEGVILAGGSGVSDHVQIGDNTTVGARGLVLKDLPPNSFYSGAPAKEHQKELRLQALLKRLPEMKRELRRLKKEIEKIREQEE